MFVERMICSKCGKEFNPKDSPLMCDDLGRIDIYYEAVKEVLTKEVVRLRSTDT